MRNIKLIVEYDGTDYHGFQIQRQEPTIQGCLEKALEKLAGEEVRVIAAGRTDAGVHAKGQVVNFRSRISVPIDRIVPALNSVLPEDIRVKEAQEVPFGFHARFDALNKTYSYRIWQGPVMSVFARRYTLWVKEPLDWLAVEQAGKLLVGTHDFAAFAASGSSVKTTVRTLQAFELNQTDCVYTLKFTADGFLYNMVRNMVGTLIEVGRGKFSIEDIPSILAGRDRSKAGPTAPPQGLCLEEVVY